MFVETWKLRFWAFLKVPMIWLAWPSVRESNDRRCVVRIPFRRRNRNHLGSMYVGVLVMGGELVGGLLAMDRIQKSKTSVALSFGSIQGEFHRRAEGAVDFVCEDGEAIGQMVDRVIESGERETMTIRTLAMVPDEPGDEPAATFEMGLSLKRRG